MKGGEGNHLMEETMLNIIYGEVEKAIYNTSVFFKNSFKPAWLEDNLAKEIVRDIDKSEVLSPYCIQSPVLGQIPPTMLAGGTKTLLLILNRPDKIFNASTCGDNCAKWILRIAKEHTITINLRHIMEFGFDDFEVPVFVEGIEVHNMKELLPLAIKGIHSIAEGVVK